jgi:hypothetical protein
MWKNLSTCGKRVNLKIQGRIMTVAEQVRSEDRSVAESELNEPIWSVISFERVEAVGLGYDEATGLLSELEDRGLPGLCIVTNEAAARIKTQE